MVVVTISFCDSAAVTGATLGDNMRTAGRPYTARRVLRAAALLVAAVAAAAAVAAGSAPSAPHHALADNGVLHMD